MNYYYWINVVNNSMMLYLIICDVRYDGMVVFIFFIFIVGLNWVISIWNKILCKCFIDIYGFML